MSDLSATALRASGRDDLARDDSVPVSFFTDLVKCNTFLTNAQKTKTKIHSDPNVTPQIAAAFARANQSGSDVLKYVKTGEMQGTAFARATAAYLRM